MSRTGHAIQSSIQVVDLLSENIQMGLDANLMPTEPDANQRCNKYKEIEEFTQFS